MAGRCPMSSRRGFLAALGGAAAVAGAGPQGFAETLDSGARAKGAITPPSQGDGPGRALVEPFRGDHQGGIATALQSHTYMLAFDLTARSAEDVVRLLKLWTLAAERMTAGETAAPLDPDRAVPAADSG